MTGASRSAGRVVWKAVLTLAAVEALAACGSGGIPLGGPLPPSAPRIDLQSTPVALYDPATGKTTVTLDFLVRDGAGTPVDPAAATLRRLINGSPPDAESVARLEDTKLYSSLTLGMVLDASYSMTQWHPPAFDPMKQAALDTLESIRGQFASWNNGTFQPLVSWFQDQYVCTETSTAMPDTAVLQIPTPVAGAGTKLYAATAQMVDRMKQVHDASTAWTDADHFAIVVFTDGFDNYSTFDSSGILPTSYPATGGAFACVGPGPVTLDDLVARLQAFPQLKVYVIGLGNQVKYSELNAIATAGRGRLVSNPDTTQVGALFSDVTREFTTERRDTITMLLPAGDYLYEESVTVQGATGRVKFRFHAGDAASAVDASSITTE